MSSKAENTFKNSSQQYRLRIFFRHPLLIKIVAWLGSLSFIGSTGVVWADLQPISASSVETKEIVQASASGTASESKNGSELEVMGPPLPVVSQQPSAASIASQPLSARQVSVVNKSIAATNTRTPNRLEHGDLLAANHYTVGVMGSEREQLPSSAAISIPVLSPVQNVASGRAELGNRDRDRREQTTNTNSRIKPTSGKKRAIVSQSIPASGINPKSDRAQFAIRPLPKVNFARSTADRSSTAKRTITAPTPIAFNPHLSPGSQRKLTSLKPTTVTPLKPSPSSLRRTKPTIKTAQVERIQPILPQTAVEIPVPPPLTQTIEVPRVAQLPQLTTNKPVPRVTPLPTIQPATASQPQPVSLSQSEVSYTNSEFIYPLATPAPITSRYGWRTHPITGNRRFHSGIDIGAPMGAPVVATGNGTVVTAGWMGGYGKAIIIQHNGVQQTLYGHLSDISVQPGQQIERGTVIGRVGSTGNSTGPHLHFEIRMATNDGWVATDPYQEVKYALDNLRQAMPVVRRDIQNRRSY
jgi:murein DD-endopeptidase MepM/ murein hydrolase activator NlpD